MHELAKLSFLQLYLKGRVEPASGNAIAIQFNKIIPNI